MSRSTSIRIASGVVAACLLFPAAWAGGGWWALLAYPVLLVSLFEYFSMVLPTDRGGQVLGVVSGMVVGVAITTGHAQGEGVIALWAGSIFGPALWFLLRTGDIETVASRVALFSTGMTWLGALGGLATSLVFLHQGFSWLVLAAGLAFGSDIGAFFVGRALGRTPLHPKISPKKTVEGSVGGLAMATMFAFGFRALIGPDIPTVHLWVLAPVGALFGQLGDLAQSMLKRSVGVKDSGFIMPGHGGLFDRIDALLFIGPALFLYARLVLGTEVQWLKT